MLIGLVPVDVSIAAAAFILAVVFSGYVSLGSIVAAFSIPSSLIVRYNIFGANIEGYHLLIYFSLGLMMLVMYTHRANIKRLIEGTENRFAKLHLIRLKHKESKQSTKKPESE
jgi:glycerol-3-phosphate acyltransferase PlsY